MRKVRREATQETHLVRIPKEIKECMEIDINVVPTSQWFDWTPSFSKFQARLVDVDL